jgi:hypothetical protein
VNSGSRKPVICLFYNDTKGSTDTFDQLCHLKTVARKTHRRPLRLLYGLLHVAFIYNPNHAFSRTEKCLVFLKNLAFFSGQVTPKGENKFPSNSTGLIQMHLGDSCL